MIVPSDPDYVQTKLIKQGKELLNPDFKPLAEWINEYYKVKVLNIYYDMVDGPRDYKFPRLNIIFEFEEEELKFRNGPGGNFHADKQEMINRKFHELVVKKSSPSRLLDRLFRKDKYESNEVLVIFDAFKPLAIREANNAIPQSEIDRLKRELAAKGIWEIYREFSSTVYFFYTEKQLEDYRIDGTTAKLNSQYLDLLKQFDEFNYIDTTSFTLSFDSRENFEKVFLSNWFYYFKR